MTKQELNDMKQRLLTVITSALAKHRAKVDEQDKVVLNKSKIITDGEKI